MRDTFLERRGFQQAGGRAAAVTPYLELGTDDAGGIVRVPEAFLKQHALVFGGSGYGKSFFTYLLVKKQLELGCSLVVLDPKRDTVRWFRGLCAQMGVPPGNVATIDPTDPEAVPGLNPFRSGASPAEAAASIVKLFSKIEAFTGPRIKAFLLAAIPVAAWHGLPIAAVLSLLEDEGFRDDILSSEPLFPAGPYYRKQADYLRTNFLKYKPGDRDESVRSINTSFAEILGNDMFLEMFSSETNGVDFDALFRRQGAALVSLDLREGLTDEGAGLIAGIVVDQLYAAARRKPGPIPVVLAVDEIRKLSGFLEDGLRDVVNMARSSNIRIIAAAQHERQLSEGLRDDLKISTAIKAYFNAGDDGRTADTAAALALRSHVAAKEALRAAPPARSWPAYEGPVYARVRGRERLGPLPISTRYDPPAHPLVVDPEDPASDIKRFVFAARYAVPPLYVRDGASGFVEASPMFASLPPGSVSLQWKNRKATVSVKASPPPIPPPTISEHAARWTGVLMGLEDGQAVLLLRNELEPKWTKFPRFMPEPDAPPSYLAASRRSAAVGRSPYVPPARPSTPERSLPPEPNPLPERPAPPPEAKVPPPKVSAPPAPKPKKDRPEPAEAPKRPDRKVDDDDGYSIV